ncbi:MAG: SDR family oxidoreductase [Actinophytocola sp.]|nr:SDR family oxidoreductase [Actinophytocola sp.]
MLPEDTFAGKVAVVTGGGSGIGYGVAHELAGLGATVVGRRAEVLREASEQIAQAGGTVVGRVGDVRDRDRIEEIVAELFSEHGPVDLLVNAAAGNFRVRPEEMSPNAWNAVVRIVLDGTWNWTQVVGQRAIEDGRDASVLSIGTVGALQGGPETAHSASAKAGVVAMTKSLAAAWGRHGIRVNLVTPGITEDTRGAAILLAEEETWERAISQIPLQRSATLTEVTDAALYLLSDYASYITGANLVVDGGRALGKA